MLFFYMVSVSLRSFSIAIGEHISILFELKDYFIISRFILVCMVYMRSQSLALHYIYLLVHV